MAELNAEPPRLDLELYEGDPFHLGITFDFDLTGYHGWAGRARRRNPGDSDALVPFMVDPVDAEPNRRVVFHITPTVALSHARYDLQVLDPNNEPRTFLAGQITVARDVTPQ